MLLFIGFNSSKQTVDDYCSLSFIKRVSIPRRRNICLFFKLVGNSPRNQAYLLHLRFAMLAHIISCLLILLDSRVPALVADLQRSS